MTPKTKTRKYCNREDIVNQDNKKKILNLEL